LLSHFGFINHQLTLFTNRSRIAWAQLVLAMGARLKKIGPRAPEAPDRRKNP
jgi:hypothetical protein